MTETTPEQVEAAAREVVRTCREWQGEDGPFPEPQYDDFCTAVDRLEELLDMRAPICPTCLEEECVCGEEDQ